MDTLTTNLLPLLVAVLAQANATAHVVPADIPVAEFVVVPPNALSSFPLVVPVNVLDPFVPSRYSVPVPRFAVKAVGVLGAANATVPVVPLAPPSKSHPAMTLCARALDVIIAIATTQATTANPRAKSDLSTANLLWNSGETIPSGVLAKSRNVPIPTPRP